MPAPLGDELILAALRDTGGTAIAVDDAEILADLRDFAAGGGPAALPGGCGLPDRGPAAARRRLDRRRTSGWWC